MANQIAFPSRITLVSGPIGAGKTTRVRAICDSARKRGERVTGLLTLKIGADRWVEDLDSGEQFPLCVANSGQTAVISTSRYVFLPEGIARANEVLRRACPTDILIIDELGPLEFDQSNGFMESFPVLASGEFREAYVVVRDSLLAEGRRRWPGAQVETITF